MKNYLVVLSALLFFLSSCTQQEDVLELGSQNSNKVRIDFDLPETALTPVTRSSNGVALRFIMEAWMYDEAAKSYSVESVRVEQLANNNSASFEFDLQTQGKYRLLFWADYVDANAEVVDEKYVDNYYETSSFSNQGVYRGLKAVKVSATNFSLNNEARDAFYGSVDFEKNEYEVYLRKQTLTRAVGKLMLKEKDAEAFIDSESLSVNYNVPNTFNVESGNTTASTYNVNVTNIALAGNVEAKDLTLFFDYVLAAQGEAGYTINNIVLSGKDWRGEEYIREGIPNLPIKQNRRTVVSGTRMLIAPKVEGDKVTVDTDIFDTWEDDLDIEGDIDTTPQEVAFEGEGTEAAPFIIASVEDFAKLMEVINEGKIIPETEDILYTTAYYKQTENVEAIGKITIGTNENPFKGVYDGDAKTISGLIATDVNAYATGLFGVIDGAILKNMRVLDARNMSAAGQAGGICGMSRGESFIENVLCAGVNIAGADIASATICAYVQDGLLTIKSVKAGAKGSTVVKTKAVAEVGGCVGGIVGYVAKEATVVIEDSYNEVKITNTNSDLDVIGGICGKNEGLISIKRSYVSGNITTVKAGANALCDGIIGAGTVAAEDNYVVAANNKGTNTTEAIVFSAETWPTWSADVTSWANLGGIIDEMTTYPTLDWE